MFPSVERICDLFFERNEKELIKIAKADKFDFTIISPEKKDKNRSFIHLAILNNMTKLVMVLFDSGHYDVNKRDNHNLSYLSAAVVKDDYDLVDYFIDDLHIDDHDCINSARTIDMIKYLVEKGMNINHNTESADKNDLLQNAIKWDLLDIAYWLLTNYSNEFNINEKEIYTGKTLLHSAVMCQNKSCMKYLLDRGFDINIEDRKEQTPLMYAARFGKYDSYVYITEYKKEHKIPTDTPAALVETARITKILDEQEKFMLTHHKDPKPFIDIRLYRRNH